MKNEWTGERLETFVFNETTIEHLHRYALAKELAHGKTILDIACGEGYGSNLLASAANAVTGVDIDSETIRHAADKYKRNNLSFLQGSVKNMPVASHIFDLVVSFETLEHIPEHQEMMTEIKRVLKPNGCLIISTPEKKNYTDIPNGNNPFHKRELYEAEFIALVKTHFLHVSVLYQNFLTASLMIQPASNRLTFYEGSYEEIRATGNIEPLYLIALCSDQDLPVPASSIFTSKGLFETALAEKEREMRNTFSYQLGHVLLWPLKLIRNLLFSSRKKR